MEKAKKFINKEKFLLDMEYELITSFIKTRKDMKITQQELADKAGMIRESIARIEKQYVSPQLDTFLKMINALDCKLVIVPNNEEN